MANTIQNKATRGLQPQSAKIATQVSQSRETASPRVKEAARAADSFGRSAIKGSKTPDVSKKEPNSFRGKLRDDSIWDKGISAQARTESLKSLGTSSESMKMIEEIAAKVDVLRAQDPGTAGAWGLGCGGVSC